MSFLFASQSESSESKRMWFFSGFFRLDPSKEEEEDTNKAIETSRDEEEYRIRRQREEEEAENEQIEKAKKESLKLAKRAEKKRRQRNRVFETESGRDMQSKANVNPPPNICNGCNSGIDQDGIYINAYGTLWHPECLSCLHCHNPIATQEISNSRGMFHRACYKEHRRPNCYVCNNKIPLTEQGIKYSFHPFWEEIYCPSHDRDGTAKCCSCERLEAYGTRYVMLADGRWLCIECMECAIMDTYECHQLHLEIRDFFESLHMRIEKEFPLLLVEKEALNRAEEEEGIGHQYGIVTRGICLSEEQIVTSVSERPKMGPNNQLIGMATESQMVVRRCEVTAILILYGLPRFLTGYILAHEMMHAYLRLKGYRNLNPVLEEGICQMLGHMWLETQRYRPIDPAASSSVASSSRTPPPVASTSKKGDQSDFEKMLVKFCEHQIETDDSPIYGLGFKEVRKMMVSNHYNLKDTLREIQRWC